MFLAYSFKNENVFDQDYLNKHYPMEYFEKLVARITQPISLFLFYYDSVELGEK